MKYRNVETVFSAIICISLHIHKELNEREHRMTIVAGWAGDLTESQNKFCWNRSLKSLSPTFDQTSP